MKRSVKGTLHLCDAPDCDVARFEEKNGDPVEGVGGTVYEIDAHGGRTYEWWACGPNHASAAMASVIEKGEYK